jgi:hypothetical protein
LEKLYHITIKYTEWPQNIPNGPEIDQMAIKNKPTSDIAKPSKIYQKMGFFGSKICHLATLAESIIPIMKICPNPEKMAGR